VRKEREVWHELPGNFRCSWAYSIDISIAYGGATSDCLAFKASKIYDQLEDGLLRDVLFLLGDNAYLNSRYMVTPFPRVGPRMPSTFINPRYVLLKIDAFPIIIFLNI
jgi:hypothetical protein